MMLTESIREALLVLVVDPDPDVRLILRLMLEHRGHVVVATDDPATALELARAAVPDVVIGEHPLRLPSGTLLCEALLHERGTHDIPFLALTTAADAEELREARRTHAAGVAVKPVLPSEIVRLIETLPCPRPA